MFQQVVIRSRSLSHGKVSAETCPFDLSSISGILVTSAEAAPGLWEAGKVGGDGAREEMGKIKDRQ